MAGDWIKMEAATPDKPEVWEIADALDIDPDAAFGKLFRVWNWFDQHTENGNAPAVTTRLRDRLVGVTGFCNCMISAGWMVEAEGRIELPNFERHNGKTAKNRALTAKRVANHKRQGNSEGNEQVTPEPLPREEKRREEEKTTARSGQKGYTEEFERAWQLYPKRFGDNPKARAFKAWNARLREGHTPDEIIAGIERYAKWCSACDKTGTELVKQAATFLGPDKGFSETWETKQSKQETREATLDDASPV